VLGLSAARALHHPPTVVRSRGWRTRRARPRGGATEGATLVLDRRREVVEHPFGSIKQWMYQGAFLTKGLEKVRAEFSLTALAYNLRRAIVGVEGLMVAVRA